MTVDEAAAEAARLEKTRVKTVLGIHSKADDQPESQRIRLQEGVSVADEVGGHHADVGVGDNNTDDVAWRLLRSQTTDGYSRCRDVASARQR